MCQSDRGFDNFRRTNLYKLYALDKSNSLGRNFKTTSRFRAHYNSNSEHNVGNVIFPGKSDGNAKMNDPQAIMTLNLKFGASTARKE